MEQFKHKESNPKLYHTLFKDERIFNEKKLTKRVFYILILLFGSTVASISIWHKKACLYVKTIMNMTLGYK